MAMKEIRILNLLKYPYIVQYLSWFTKEDYAWIVTEYCERGSLQDFIDDYCRTGEYVLAHSLMTERYLHEKEIAYVVRAALKALEYMHSKGIAHHDVKAGNCMATLKLQAKD